MGPDNWPSGPRTRRQCLRKTPADVTSKEGKVSTSPLSGAGIRAAGFKLEAPNAVSPPEQTVFYRRVPARIRTGAHWKSAQLLFSARNPRRH